METFSESVKYTFTRDELVQIAKDQARHMQSRTGAEEQFDNLKADFKSKTTRIDADISDCTRRITSGYEMRPVRCISLKFRPDKDHALIVRTDNGRVLRTRKLETEEKQTVISAEPPEEFTFMADFYSDSDSDVAELVAGMVDLTTKEAEELRGVVDLKPTRKMLE